MMRYRKVAVTSRSKGLESQHEIRMRKLGWGVSPSQTRRSTFFIFTCPWDSSRWSIYSRKQKGTRWRLERPLSNGTGSESSQKNPSSSSSSCLMTSCQMEWAAVNLVYSQSSKGQRFTGLCVDQQDFSIQNHTLTSGEGLRDVVLEVGHLEHSIIPIIDSSVQNCKNGLGAH